MEPKDYKGRPPFHSKDFQEVAIQKGFDHHQITLLRPTANGEVERFMQMLNKPEQIAHLPGKDGLERQ